MINHVVGNIFDQPVSTIIQSCNCFHTFGGGIAREIRYRFPQAYQADLTTPCGDILKLGTFSCAEITKPKHKHIKHVYNVYGQFDIEPSKRNTNYAALAKGFWAVLQDFKANQRKGVIGIPHSIGCGLGGGDWLIVSAILDDVFLNSGIADGVDVLIARLP